MPSLNYFFFLTLKKNNDKETDVIAAKVAMVDLVVELNLPLSTLDRINKVFKKSLRIQTLLKGQLKMFLFLVLISSFSCLLFFFSVIRGRHVCYSLHYGVDCVLSRRLLHLKLLEHSLHHNAKIYISECLAVEIIVMPQTKTKTKMHVDSNKV